MSNQVSRDPYADFVLAQLLTPTEAVRLSRAEQLVLVAAVRSEVLTNPKIRTLLVKKVKAVTKELAAARKKLPIRE